MLLPFRWLWYQVAVTLAGVSASAAIGVGSFNADVSISGVAAGASVGTPTINVDFVLGSVAANPEIGTGTVETGEPGDVTVLLTGVSANPHIGTGRVDIKGHRIITDSGGAGPRRRPAKKPEIVKYVPPTIRVYSVGTFAEPSIGGITCNVSSELSPAIAEALIGSGVFDSETLITAQFEVVQGGTVDASVRIVADLLPEEIIALLEAA